MEKAQLTLDYLTTRRNQALRDVETFSAMIAEIEKLANAEKKAEKHSSFLKVVASVKKENE